MGGGEGGLWTVTFIVFVFLSKPTLEGPHCRQSVCACTHFLKRLEANKLNLTMAGLQIISLSSLDFVYSRIFHSNHNYIDNQLKNSLFEGNILAPLESREWERGQEWPRGRSLNCTPVLVLETRTSTKDWISSCKVTEGGSQGSAALDSGTAQATAQMLGKQLFPEDPNPAAAPGGAFWEGVAKINGQALCFSASTPWTSRSESFSSII